MSYSRRQLYFAEALALQLQQAGLDVWFDLQQLHAGSVWSDGLKDGVQDAGRLVLVVSQAALD
ncbi:MAG: toll/interleukin-1 receptor domain-containing protein, partial [Rhizobacter sp.]|nr:toll/interleukin-1 receptor domain-containing protein [Rhizobacter sp.]